MFNNPILTLRIFAYSRQKRKFKYIFGRPMYAIKSNVPTIPPRTTTTTKVQSKISLYRTTNFYISIASIANRIIPYTTPLTCIRTPYELSTFFQCAMLSDYYLRTITHIYCKVKKLVTSVSFCIHGCVNVYVFHFIRVRKRTRALFHARIFRLFAEKMSRHKVR